MIQGQLGSPALVLAIILLSFQLIGCGSPLSPFWGRERVAPSSPQETGVIVRGAGEEEIAALLKSHPQARYRVLNARHGMYEIFQLRSEIVKAQVPKAEVAPNVFFSTQPQIPISDRLQALSDGDEELNFDKCQQGENSPVAVIEVETLKNEVASRLLKKGSQLKLNSRGSVNHHQPGKELKVAWLIMSPEGSRERERLVVAPELSVDLEALGTHGIGLIVQDDRQVCGLDLIEFAVTTNTTYRGPAAQDDEAARKIDLSKVDHLQKIELDLKQNLSWGQGQLIAVIDTGVHYNHPLLRNKIFVNKNEIAENGVDDDQNGFVDDTNGYDFQLQDAYAYDDVGHGTHVAGLIAADGFGVARNAQILPIKALGAFGGDVASVTAAIRYAVDSGATIINMSLGNYRTPHPELIAAMKYAESKKVLIVAASGNGHPMTGLGVDTDEFAHYPSTLPMTNILAVAAQDHEFNLAPYSNYGVATVDIAILGGTEDHPLFSTYIENPLGLDLVGMQGTSMATPLAAGVAAVLWAKHPNWSIDNLIAHLVSSGIPHPNIHGKIRSGRFLTFAKALEESTQATSTMVGLSSN